MNVFIVLCQVVVCMFWYVKCKSYKVLFWCEIILFVIFIFLENICVLLMGVFSIFFVSWLGKEVMVGVGFVDSFNMVIMVFFVVIDFGIMVVVVFSFGKCDR